MQGRPSQSWSSTGVAGGKCGSPVVFGFQVLIGTSLWSTDEEVALKHPQVVQLGCSKPKPSTALDSACSFSKASSGDGSRKAKYRLGPVLCGNVQLTKPRYVRKP